MSPFGHVHAVPLKLGDAAMSITLGFAASENCGKPCAAKLIPDGDFDSGADKSSVPEATPVSVSPGVFGGAGAPVGSAA